MGADCQVEQVSIWYGKMHVLGHVIGSGGVEPEPSKVMAVKRFEAPKTKTEVQAFLGLTGYYWFIPNYAAVALLLTELTKKVAPTEVTWTAQCEAAFQELKRLLCCWRALTLRSRLSCRLTLLSIGLGQY